MTTPWPPPCWKLGAVTASHAIAPPDAAFVIVLRSSWYSEDEAPEGRVKKTLVS